MDLGLHYTFNDANSVVDPEVLAIAERVTPNLSSAFGKVWDLFGQRSAPLQTEIFEVLARSYTQPELTGTDWDDAADTTDLPIDASEIDRITVGDVLLIEDEIVVVKSIDRGANTIDVYERGVGETTAAAHGTAPLLVKVIGNACIEGTVDVTAMAEDTGIFTNYCQLVEEMIDLSKADSDQARRFGQTEPVLKAEAMERVLRDLARTAVHGVSRAGTAVYPSMTRGLLQWLSLAGGVSTNVGDVFNQDALDDILQEIRLLGGMPKAIVMSVANKLIFNTFTSADIVRQDVNEKTAGRIVEGYLADGFGVIPVIVDLDMRDTEVAIVDTAKMSKGWKVNDTLRFVPETNVSSRERKETLQGKFGLAMEGIGTSHGLLVNLG